MADEDQLKILRRGATAWNEWREKHPGVLHPDLSEVRLSEVDLEGASLHGADLHRASPLHRTKSWRTRGEDVEAGLGRPV
jgi:hypothetical protein